MADDDSWFEPKRFGYGAGWPIAWQGWALVGGYLLLVLAATRLLPQHRLAFGMTVGALTLAVLPICAAHTRGGWRWRWGGDD